MDKERKILSDAADMEEEADSLTNRQLKKLEEEITDPSRSALFKKVITPDFSNEDSMEVDVNDIGKVNPFTKELRTSNISSNQLQYIIHASDVSRFASSMGFKRSVMTLVSDIQTLLSAAPSQGGMLLKLMSSEYSFKTIGVTKQKGGFFNRKEGNE